MSHLTCISLQVKDLDALEKAAADCGLALVRGQKTFKWYGVDMDDYDGPDAARRNGIDPKEFGRCEHALTVAGDAYAYEIGVVADKNQPGTFLLAYDFWGTHGEKLQTRIGATGEKLKQSYATHVSTAALTKRGFKLTGKTQLDNGSLQLTFKGY